MALNEYIGAAVALSGAVFMLLAAVGVLRMPDTLMRMQVSTKVSTLGIALISGGAAIWLGSLMAAVAALLIIVLFMFTAPVAAHLISRAAYRHGEGLYHRTKLPEKKELGSEDH